MRPSQALASFDVTCERMWLASGLSRSVQLKTTRMVVSCSYGFRRTEALCSVVGREPPWRKEQIRTGASDSYAIDPSHVSPMWLATANAL